MKTANLQALMQSARKTLSKNSPKILIGVGIVGFTSSIVMAVKATPKACRLLEEKKQELETDKLPVAEVVKATWKCYLPVAVCGLSSAACIIFANRIDGKRMTALSTAYSLSETAFKDYVKAVEETVSDNKKKDIRAKLAQNKLDEKGAPTESELNHISPNETGLVWCLDGLTGQYFRSNHDLIKKAENKINYAINTDWDISLNEVLEILGERQTDWRDVGWNTQSGYLTLNIDSGLMPDKTPCLVLTYSTQPKVNAWKLCE